MSTAASSGRRCLARPLLPLRRKLRGCSPCLLNDHATPELRLKTGTQSGASPGYAPQPRHQSHRARAHHDDADPRQGRASHRGAHDHPRQEGPAATQKLFRDIAPRFSDRSGGYTRIVAAGWRVGDGAKVAILELIGSELKKKEKKEKGKKESPEETQEAKAGS